MLTIKRKNPYCFGTYFDFELSNGELLHISEWNGERYYTENDIYRPIYKEDESGDFEIIGFEEI